MDATKLEILKMARELVINEYIDRRAQEHNEWLEKSTQLWKTKRESLAYPIIPPYPTEIEIITRAKILLEFLKDDNDEKVSSNVFSDQVKQMDLTEDNIIIDMQEISNNENEQKVNNKIPGLMHQFQSIRTYFDDHKK
jgi:hypothetical protein